MMPDHWVPPGAVLRAAWPIYVLRKLCLIWLQVCSKHRLDRHSLLGARALSTEQAGKMDLAGPESAHGISADEFAMGQHRLQCTSIALVARGCSPH